MRIRTTTLATVAALVLAIAAPVSVFAADGAPDVAVDPAGAVVDPAPADPAPTVDPATPVATAEGGDTAVVEAAGIADATPADPAPRVTPAATAATSTVPTGRGSLPFTGTDDGQLLMLLLVGSLLVAGGATSWSWARAEADAA
jgi:hypothetical protein